MNNILIAKPESILAFMLFQGWKLAETNEMYYILTKEGEKDIRFHIPKKEETEDFNFQVNNVVQHLARIYNWDKTLLLLFLSIKPKDIDTLFQGWLKTQLLGENAPYKAEVQVTLSPIV